MKNIGNKILLILGVIKMKIHYSSSLWSKDKGRWGLPQRVNWEFDYADSKRCIPTIYRFPKGIVFDIITFLDEGSLHEYFKKYESIEEKLTSIERHCAEQEHPYQQVPVKDICINGKHVENGYSSSSAISVPWDRNDDILLPVRRTYSSILNDTSCFACERFCIPYPEAESRVKNILRFLQIDKVNNMKLSTHSRQRFYPLNISFEMSAEENEKDICFIHPITNIVHKIYLQNPKFIEIPLPNESRNIYALQSRYEIEPNLQNGDTLQFNSSLQYDEAQILSKNKYHPKSASSIGIIGGSEKDTTCGLHGLPLNNCFSIPSLNPLNAWDFKIEGINIKEHDSEEFSLK